MTGDDMIQRVERYRLATQQIVDADDVPFNKRCLGLIDLAQMARGEDDVELRQWAERAVYEVAAAFLGLRPEPAVPGDPLGRRHLAMRAEGYERCPRCLSQLAHESDVQRWAAMWKSWTDEVAVRAGRADAR